MKVEPVARWTSETCVKYGTGAGVRDPKAIMDDVWRWLPVFRAVAETESATLAARVIGVSGPSVSRAVRQIEEGLGRELFARKGRKLILNPDGAALLDTLRKVESQLHATIARLAGAEASGAVRLAAFGQLGAFLLLPAAADLNRRFPDIEISVGQLDPEPALQQVEARMLDLYLGVNIAAGEPLVHEVLARPQMAIYAGHGHPLYGAVGSADWRRYGFVAQHRPSLTRSVWPASEPRNVTLRTDSHGLALQACLAGTHLMVMERAIARHLVEAGQLSELRAEFLERATLVLVRHGHREQDARLEKVGEAIRRVVAERFGSG